MFGEEYKLRCYSLCSQSSPAFCHFLRFRSNILLSTVITHCQSVFLTVRPRFTPIQKQR